MPLRTTHFFHVLILVSSFSFGQDAQHAGRLEPYIDVRSMGAVGDGQKDDTQAIAAAVRSCAANGGMIYFPYTSAAYITSKSLELPSRCDLKIDGVLRGTASMEAVVTVGGAEAATRHRIFGVGTIDSGNLARRHISLTNYAHFEITGLTLLNGATVAGIDIGPQSSKGGFEAYIHDMNLFVPQGVAGVPGSVGIWSDKGTDSSVYNLAIVGWDIGVRNNIHGNQPFANIHVWGFGPNPGWHNISNLPSVCFDDIAGDAQWVSDNCDTPTDIGLHAHGYNDQITGFSCFNNEIWGSDNVVRCIQFDLSRPYSSVMNSTFVARKGHRLASDVTVPGDNYAQVEMVGNFTIANVVKSRSMTAHFSNTTVETNLNLGGPIKFFGQGDQVFGNTAGGFRFEVAGASRAEISNVGEGHFQGGLDVGPSSAYLIGGAVVLPSWVGSYSGGTQDKSVQLASGKGAVNHLPAYDSAGGLVDSRKLLLGAADFVPTVANAIGCLDGWDHLPCTVAKVTPTTRTMRDSIPFTQVFVTSAPMAVYQAIVTFHKVGGAAEGIARPSIVMGKLRESGVPASNTESGVATANITVEEGPGVPVGYTLDLSGDTGAVQGTLSMEVVRIQ